MVVEPEMFTLVAPTLVLGTQMVTGVCEQV
jgi:hypothetical protein